VTCATGLCLAIVATAASAADAPPRAARSVHLWYTAPAAVAFYNEVTVDQSTPGSYFMACGFGHGYFGIQDRTGDKVVLFSVWDPTKGDNPNAVAAEQRVQVLHQDPRVTIKRFGGEGTGAQCFLPYEWKTGETCRFLVTASPARDQTAYAAYFFRNDTHQWRHLATFQTRTAGDPLKGLYSFVEDFRRDGRSPGEVRKARYTNGWVKSGDGRWLPLTKARFTADKTPLDDIDAAPVEGGFSLATGGETRTTHPLGSTLTRPADHASPPADLAELTDGRVPDPGPIK